MRKRRKGWGKMCSCVNWEATLIKWFCSLTIGGGDVQGLEMSGDKESIQFPERCTKQFGYSVNSY